MTQKKSMKRKKSDVPTRIYSYRLLPPISEQTRVEDQFRLAHQYRNGHVEIEHRLRDWFREAQLEHPTIRPTLRLLEDAQAGVDDAYDDLHMAKSGTANPDLTGPRDHLAMTKELRTIASAELREAKRPSMLLSAARKAADKLTKEKEDPTADAAKIAELSAAATAAAEAATIATADDEALLAAYEKARDRAHHARTALRHDYSGRGLRHGAYIRVENAIKQAVASSTSPLSFERYDGTGSIGTQLTVTGTATRKAVDVDAVGIGMTWGELISGLDPRLRLGSPGQADVHPRAEVTGKAWTDVAAMPRNVRRHAARTYVDLRIASGTDRSPIFARFPVTLHRLPPKDAVIKWAYIVRRRVGFHYEWRFQLTLESRTFDKPPVAIGTGACAVNLGWRRLLDDEGNVAALRAAYVVDEFGKEREISVPDHRGRPVLSAVGKCDGLAKTRDEALERAQLTLSRWLSERGGVPAEWLGTEATRPDGSVPKTMADRLRGYSAWRAAWKLRRFVDLWKGRRATGDDAIFTELSAWAKQDRHLESWQAHQREKIIARRRETWRVIAAELARTYATILVGESRLTDIDGWEKKAPEDGDPSEGREQRRMSRICAPGELRAEIEKAVAKTGASTVRCEEQLATQTCASCGHDERWDAAPSVMHACGGCGKTWDQDANYCRNLLARNGFASGAEPRSPAEPLAAVKRMRSRGSAGSAAVAALGPER